MMNSSILRWSLGRTQSSALKLPAAVSPRGTWPAIFAGKSETSKLWIERMPDSPEINRFQTCSAPTPKGVTRPRPVTTTRLMLERYSGGMRFDELHSVFNGHDLLRGIVRDLAAELFFERHHQLDRVEAIGAEIVDETRIVRDLGLVDAQVLHNDLFYPLGDIAHHSTSTELRVIWWCIQRPWPTLTRVAPAESDVYLT